MVSPSPGLVPRAAQCRATKMCARRVRTVVDQVVTSCVCLECVDLSRGAENTNVK
jgi:hypothetical protein